MSLNAYTVLDAFTSFLRLLLGLLVVAQALPAWWKWSAALPSERKAFLEDRSYLLFLLATVLLALNVASWPLLYLLLQSYVGVWPGAMCIYGVTQIGAGSIGPSRFLPGLLTALQVTKPALVFLTGSWFVLYWINRRTATAPLMSRVLVAVMLVGLLAVVDAGIECTYLAIPKREDLPSTGCCTLVFDTGSRTSLRLLGALLGGHYAPRLAAAYYILNIGMCLGLTAYVSRPPARARHAILGALGLGALVSLVVSLLFLIEVASPTLLHLPNHHCPYDLLPNVPESMVPIALFVLGCFTVGWACLAGWLGNTPETKPFLARALRVLLGVALIGYLGSVAMLSLELVLA
jgi:hypothetical protein